MIIIKLNLNQIKTSMQLIIIKTEDKNVSKGY